MTHYGLKVRFVLAMTYNDRCKNIITFNIVSGCFLYFVGLNEMRACKM